MFSCETDCGKGKTLDKVKPWQEGSCFWGWGLCGEGCLQKWIASWKKIEANERWKEYRDFVARRGVSGEGIGNLQGGVDISSFWKKLLFRTPCSKDCAHETLKESCLSADLLCWGVAGKQKVLQHWENKHNQEVEHTNANEFSFPVLFSTCFPLFNFALPFLASTRMNRDTQKGVLFCVQRHGPERCLSYLKAFKRVCSG